MEITHKKYKGLSLVIVEGTLKSKEGRSINEIVMNSASDEAVHLWVDCADLKDIIRMNRSLSDFLNFLLQQKLNGANILLYAVDDNTSRILKLLKLDEAFIQVPTLDDAYLTLSDKLVEAS